MEGYVVETILSESGFVATVRSVMKLNRLRSGLTYGVMEWKFFPLYSQAVAYARSLDADATVDYWMDLA